MQARPNSLVESLGWEKAYGARWDLTLCCRERQQGGDEGEFRKAHDCERFPSFSML